MQKLRLTYFGFICLLILLGCKQESFEKTGIFNPKVDSLVRLSHNMLLSDYKAAEQKALLALKLSEIGDYNAGIVSSMGLLAEVKNHNEEFGFAYSYIDSAINLAEKFRLEALLAESWEIKGYICFSESKYDSAYFWYMKALPQYINQEEKIPLSNLYSKIGRVYYAKKEYELALSYYEKALKITRKYGNDKSVARDLNNLGSVYEYQNKYENALIYFEEALKINLEANRLTWIAINYHNIAKIYSDKNEPDSAIKYYNKAIEIDRDLGNKSNIAQDLFSLGYHYQQLGAHKKAIPVYKESEGLCSEINDLRTLIMVSQELSTSYSAIGKHDLALQKYMLFHAVSDSLFNSKSSRRIIEMELQYQFDMEKSSLLIEEQQKRIIFLASIGVLLLVVLLMTILYSRSKLREKANIIQQSSLQDKLSYSESEIITNIIQLSEKNETLSQIVKQLNDLSIRLRKQDQELVNKIISSVKERMDQNIWKEFEIRFKEVNGTFYDKLTKKHPDLTPNEMRLCAFLKLNMSTKEIASITNQSPASLNVARSRLRKKLNIVHTEANISQFLSEL